MRVLVADDDPVYRLGLATIVRSLGHECLEASDGRQAWKMLEGGEIDVLITDRQMPYLNGVQLCEKVRKHPSQRHIYVVMATCLDTLEQAQEGMQAGADDYLVKPIQFEDVELRMIAAERVVQMNRGLEKANQELRFVARRDFLTGLGNRRCLSEDLTVLADRARRYGHRFTLAIVDIYHADDYRTFHGTKTGDDTLKWIVAAWKSTAREGDTGYRYGHCQFLFVYPEQTAADAAAAIEQLRAELRSVTEPPELVSTINQVTLTAGIAEMAAGRPSYQQTLLAADSALYQAKKAGGGQSEIAPTFGHLLPTPRDRSHV